MNMTRRSVLRRIDAFVRRNKLTDKEFSLAVCRDPLWLTRLRSGEGVTLTIIEKAEQYMAQERAA